ncbi:DUF3016 domain-containing protein [Lysobacter arvi]|uniref:DUF3016 domain-containing protein n=1 Tax=Lysobacter arvi TaxID=3038776 RepID=A0ABU1CG63_9GAMM|nr:DUF3016 domain-containing protein [Lysobacter arvi]MDR0183941.1 DUF3016 domain-containing protein [Lysobacter arvi]
MKPRLAVLLVAFAFASAAHGGARNVTDPQAPRALPESDSVNVRWEDPSRFSELRYSGNRWEASRGNWVQELATYLRDRAQQRLPDGQRLDVDIVDIRRAGSFEPWHGPNLQYTRIIRDVYPPRMTLDVRLTDADGTVIAEGERKLSDPGFLMSDSATLNSDPLRFEKRLIDRWLAQELRTAERGVKNEE